GCQSACVGSAGDHPKRLRGVDRGKRCARLRLARVGGVRDPVLLLEPRALPALSASEGGFAPLPNPPPRISCGGKAAARTEVTRGVARPPPYTYWRRGGVP